MNLIKGALHNCAFDSGASVDYAKGVVVGVIGSLMDLKHLPFDEALNIMVDMMPDRWRKASIPACWHYDVEDWSRSDNAPTQEQFLEGGKNEDCNE